MLKIGDLANRYQLDLILMFGSRVIDNVHPESDMDIALYGRQILSETEKIQLIVDEIIDINNHFIRYAQLRVPEDFQSAFLILAENKILPEGFARRMAPVVGLRNRLVPRYEKVDVEILLDTIRKSKDDFKQYVKHILEYLR